MPSLRSSVDDAKSLPAVLEARAILHPHRVAYRFLQDGEVESGRLTYDELAHLATAAASMLRRRIPVGGRVLVAHRPSLELLVALWGCWVAGIVAVPAAPLEGRRMRARAQALALDCKPLAVLTSEFEFAATLAWTETSGLQIDVVSSKALCAASEPPGGPTREATDSAGIALLQYTSGSTASPKGVIVRHAHLIANQRMIARAMGHDESSDFVSWLPPFHDMGLIGNLLQPVFVGSTCTFMPHAAFLHSPLRWVRAVSDFRARTSGAPNFAFELCADAAEQGGLAGLDLSGWTTAYCGAEPIRGATLERFSRVFAPAGFRRSALFPTYGLAEATLMVSGRRLGEGESIEPGRRVSCGPAIAPGEVLIVDPATCRPLPSSAVGEVWLRGPHVCDGYWSGDAEPDPGFHGNSPGQGGAYLRTGDLGFVEAGELFISGRLKDQLIIRGANFDPHELEAAALDVFSDAAHRGSAAFQTGGNEPAIVLACESARDAAFEPLASELRKVAAEKCDVLLDAVVFVRAGSLPRTSSGKIRRRQCADDFAQGKLRVLHEARFTTDPDADAVDIDALRRMSRAPRVGFVRGVLARHIGRAIGVEPAGLDGSAPLVGYGWDSLSAMRLTHEVQRRFGVRLPERISLEQHGLDSLSDLVAAALEAGLAPADGTQSAEPPAGMLSAGQRAFSFLARMAPDSSALNLPLVARLEGEVDAAHLSASFDAWLARHPLAAAHLSWAGADCRFVPITDEERMPRLACFDADGWSGTRLQEHLDAFVLRPFDLFREAPIRACLVRHREGVILAIVAHHICADFRSLGLMMREIGDMYQRRAAGQAVGLAARAPPFSEFVRYELALLESPEAARLRAFWQRTLLPLPAPLDLGLAKPADAESRRTAVLHRRLPARIAAGVKFVARSAGTTSFVACLGIFAVLLHRLSGSSRFVLGTPVTTRREARFCDMFGYLVNVVPLAADLSGNPRFGELLLRMSSMVAECFSHAELPLAHIVESLGLAREAGRTPLVEVIFSWQKASVPQDGGLTGFALRRPGARATVGGLQLTLHDAAPCEAQHPITLMMGEEAGDLWAALEYRADLFEDEAMASLLDAWEQLASQVIRDPDSPLRPLSLVDPCTPVGAPRLDEGPSGRRRDDHSIVDRFERAARQWPNRIAVVAGEAHWSYGRLDRTSNALAHELAVRGVGPDRAVGILAEPSAELIVAMLGVLKAGGAYVPIDPDLPEVRQREVIEGSGCATLVTSPAVASRAAALAMDRGDPPVIVAGMARQAGRAPARRIRQSNLAYMIPTSGSTGVPKTVMVEHRGVLNLFDGFEAWMPRMPAAARWTVCHSAAFDLSVWEIFGALSTGGQLLVALETERRDIGRLVRWLETRQGDVVSLTPSALQAVQGRGGAGIPASLAAVQRLVVGGEALTPDLAGRLGTSGPSAWNFYGPTEASVWTAACPVVVERGRVRMGGPIAGTRLAVLDAHLRPLPPGFAGELAIAGEGLARGYRGRAAGTAASFRPDPDGVGQRLYLTGDRAFASAGGEYGFLGRLDRQAKVRGFRVDLAEIERVLEAHGGVRQAVAIVAGDSPASRHLVAYVVAHEGAPIDEQLLLRWVAERLPSYMVPTVVSALPVIPLTRNGKADYAALGRLAGTQPMHGSGGPDASLAPFSHRVRDAWCRVLGHDQIAGPNNFFDVGGSSLSMLGLQRELELAFGRELSLIDLYRSPTVEGMARCIAGYGANAPAAPDGRGPVPPLRAAVRSRRGLRA